MTSILEKKKLKLKVPLKVKQKCVYRVRKLFIHKFENIKNVGPFLHSTADENSICIDC